MDLQYFKENVSITSLVETLGYAYNWRKGKDPKQYEHPNGDKVIINGKLNPNMEVYFTRNNYSDKGTVVDFVKNRLSMFNMHYDSEWEGVMKVLSEHAGAPSRKLNKKAPKIHEIDKGLSQFNKDDFIIKKPRMNDLTYLKVDRKLSKEILNAFLPFIDTVQEKDRRFTNIGFPYEIPGKEGLAGFELVNHLYKGHAKGSQRKNSVWVANFAPAPQLVKDIFIAESAIDAMSFYQLYKGKFSFDHSAFISTGGSLLKNQVLNVLRAYPNSKVNTLFDNDFSGKMYDIYLASIKEKREVAIRKDKDSVSFEMKKGTFNIPVDEISLSRFEKVTGIRSGVRAYKAKGKDFNEMLQTRNDVTARTRNTFKR